MLNERVMIESARVKQSARNIFFNLTATMPELPNEELSIIKTALHAILAKSQSETIILTDYEKQLVNQIRAKTRQLNRNNITRTEAYWHIYKTHPELHWAFLAHMVSRNGGWHMTDLKGSMLPELLPEKLIESYFEFLECVNYLIFKDAYPQLLLYAESKNTQKNYFHLLPALSVSRFMKPFWDHFLEERKLAPLAIALIVNEQHVIERPVIQNTYFIQTVFKTIPFQSQDLMHVTSVFFPYELNNNRLLSRPGIPIAGIAMNNFTDINTRIAVGKKLYLILFGNKKIHDGVFRFASDTPHTGSRADYWPDVFTSTRHFDMNRLIPGTSLAKIYSPALTSVWSDSVHLYDKQSDWLSSLGVLNHFKNSKAPRRLDITIDVYLKLIGLYTVVKSKQYMY
jgi:hypothetical protein